MPIPLSELAERLGAEFDGAAAGHVITGVSSIASAGPGCLVFAEEDVSFAAAMASSAGAVLVGHQVLAGDAHKPVLRVSQPRLAFARAAVLLRAPQPESSIHPTAVIALGVQMGGKVSVGRPRVSGGGRQHR